KGIDIERRAWTPKQPFSLTSHNDELDTLGNQDFGNPLKRAFFGFFGHLHAFASAPCILDPRDAASRWVSDADSCELAKDQPRFHPVHHNRRVNSRWEAYRFCAPY